MSESAMSEAVLDSERMDELSDDLVDHEFQYRPLSTAAIASVVFGVVSAVTFLAGNASLQHCLMLCPIPAVGLICGLVALKNLRELPDQLSGFRAAVAGTVMSAIGLFGGLAYAGYIHATEVPPGYVRLPFYDLRPDEIEQKGGEEIPRDVKDLDSDQIFIKGYMRPGTHVSKGGTPVRHNVNSFLLVRDSNECCFGDISTVKYYDKMLVKLVDGLNTDYSSGMFRVAGKLTIVPPDLTQGRAEPAYFLEADYVR
ncbi:MAG: DUF4190 domain-containing protein [Bythopirellula sp.]